MRNRRTSTSIEAVVIRMLKRRCCMNGRVAAASVTAAASCAVLCLVSSPGSAQGFWQEDAPKIPMAPSWQIEKAELPPYTAPRTSYGVPDLQGRWGSSGGDGLSYLEDHEFVDVTTPAQESFVSDPPGGVFQIFNLDVAGFDRVPTHRARHIQDQ